MAVVDAGRRPGSPRRSGKRSKKAQAELDTARPSRSAGKKSTSPAAPRKGSSQVRARPAARDSVTQQFFAEGERLSSEALAAHEALASTTSLRVPTQRGPMLAWALGILVAIAALLVVGWSSVWRPLIAVRPAADLTARSPQVDPSRSTPSMPMATPTEKRASRRPARPGAPSPASKRSRAAMEGPSPTPSHGDHAHLEAALPALRGYVWSPEERRLVPKSSAAAPETSPSPRSVQRVGDPTPPRAVPPPPPAPPESPPSSTAAPDETPPTPGASATEAGPT
jgi:hypothetical protein